jgi:hypothetical protein
VWIACDLLTLTADTAVWVFEWILFFVRVQVDLGILMLKRDSIIVAYFCARKSGRDDTRRGNLTMSLQKKLIPRQRLLESRGHEVISGSGMREHFEMDPKE